MTPQQKLQAIKDACRQAKPEIMKLKFGCRFLMKGILHTILGKEDSDFYCLSAEHFSMVIVGVDYVRGKRVKETGSKPEILGRPIIFPDILLAIDNILEQSEFEENGEYFTDTKIGRLLGIWDLTKNLDNNPQAWDLIHELTYKKKI